MPVPVNKILQFNQILLILFTAYFCLPKIAIVSIDKFDIRFLDFLSVLIALIVLTKIKLKREYVILFTIVILFQLLIGVYYSGIIALLYIFRLIQYILIGYGLFLLFKSNYKKYFLLMFFIIQIPISALQFISVLPNYDPARGIIYSSEFSGTFGTPAELSYFLIALTAIFLNASFKRHLLLSAFPFMSGVAFATFLMILTGLKKLIAYIPRFLIIIGPYLIILAAVIILVDINVLKSLIADPGFDVNTLKKGESFSFRDLDGPTTLLMRSVKFVDTLIYILNNELVLLFGCGYGCGYGAMDSGVIRLILEFGIIFSIFIFFISKNISKYLLFILVSINFLFDGFWSSHVAPILFAGIFMDLSLKNQYSKKITI